MEELFDFEREEYERQEYLEILERQQMLDDVEYENYLQSIADQRGYDGKFESNG